jgi:uncharacterized protein (UPF0333 family)
MRSQKRGQIWIETAIYTLIGLTAIALLLMIINPRIEKIRAESALEDTKDAMNELDVLIRELSQKAQGNVRIYNLKLGRGRLTLNSSNNSIIYELIDTNLKYSEPGIIVPDGRFNLLTKEYGSSYNIYVRLDYDDINLTYRGLETNYIFQQGSVPYKIMIENIEPENISANIEINFEVI